MIRTSLLASLFLVTALGATACRGGGSGDDSGDDIDGGNNPDDTTIYDIQGSLPVGTQVNVRGVVVTAIDEYGERKGNIWVQEPDGGAFSGVLVFGIELDDVADLEVGDLVDLENIVKDEFALTDDTSGRTTTEMTPPDGGEIIVTKVGDGTVPDPEVVDALAIGTMATDEAKDAEWEKWEGVLITLQNVTVNGELRQIGGEAQDPPFEEIRVTGPMRADTSLSAIEPVTRESCLASITGIGDYFFNYKLLPRSTDDVVGGGTDCPPPETGATACADGLDNEADGSIDCDDFDCDDLPECTTDTTVVDLQTMPKLAGTNISLDDVVVTALDNAGNNKGLWVADALAGAASNGVYVYTGNTFTAVQIGAVVDVTGTVDEFDLGCPIEDPAMGSTLTQVESSVDAVVEVTAPGAAPTPVTGLTIAMLTDVTNSEPYEGVLVQIGPVEVTAVSATGNRLTLSDGTNTIIADDDAFVYTAAMGDCFATVSGILHLDICSDERRLLPTKAGDLVPVACE